ncbi:MAG: IS3 family transposase [Actinomycetota bacterium]
MIRSVTLFTKHIFLPTLEQETYVAIFDYIEAFYNLHRRHSSLDYLSHAKYERRWPS